MSKQYQKQNSTYSEPLPNDKAVECAVIGALLLESTAINDVVHILSPDMFYYPETNAIYQAIENIYSRGEIIDMIVVSKELATMDMLDKANFATVASMTENIASSSGIVDHAMYVNQLWLSRNVAVFASKLSVDAVNRSLDISDTIDEAIKQIENISDKTCYNAKVLSVRETAYKALDLYGERKLLAQKGVTSGISTGIHDLDVITNGGWKGGQLIVLAARPAMGKTALMLHFSKSAALSGVPALIFSLEMDNQGLTNRLLLSECDINQYRFASGKLSDKEENSLSRAYERVYKMPINVDDTANISIQQIKTRSKNAKVKGQCGVILIDYLQLIDARSHNKSYNREQEVSQMSRSAKILAKELDVPVILLSQLNRGLESRGDKMPLLSDLRESGAIEQDADMVIFIHRPEYYKETGAKKGSGILRLAKQRDGGTGDIAFRYNENLTQISGYGQNENLPF